VKSIYEKPFFNTAAVCVSHCLSTTPVSQVQGSGGATVVLWLSGKLSSCIFLTS